jgi:hypothetical protein
MVTQAAVEVYEATRIEHTIPLETILKNKKSKKNASIFLLPG